jgi:hypothetical protein
MAPFSGKIFYRKSLLHDFLLKSHFSLKKISAKKMYEKLSPKFYIKKCLKNDLAEM